jgi:phage repressor protein C with HTH and peptisase S24 domain
MGWATPHIARLRAGEAAVFRPLGNSMHPRIRSGQLCTVEPAEPALLAVGDIVLCVVRGTQYLHFIKAIESGRYQIGNNRGRINGWISPDAIFGRVTSVQD